MLTEFKFVWCDAWMDSSEGYNALLEQGLDKTKLLFLVNNQPYIIDIDEIHFEKELIQTGIFSCNKKAYQRTIEDGSSWALLISTDTVTLRTYGNNGYPIEFANRMRLLKQYGLKPAKLDSFEYDLSEVISNTKICDFNDEMWNVLISTV